MTYKDNEWRIRRRKNIESPPEDFLTQKEVSKLDIGKGCQWADIPLIMRFMLIISLESQE